MGQVCYRAHGEVRRQLIGVYCLLLCGLPGLNSGCQSRQQLPLPTGTFHWPLYHVFYPTSESTEFHGVTEYFLSTVPYLNFSHV